MSAKIRLGVCDPADLGIVPAGKVIIFMDPNDNKLKAKKDDQSIVNLEDTDVLVAVSSNDTTPGYLEDKVSAGLGIQLNTLNDGANETLEVVANVQSVFGRVGEVVAEAGDYNAIQITFDDTAAGVNGATVQAAVDDLGVRLALIEAQTYVNSFNGRVGDVVTDTFQATQQAAQTNVTTIQAILHQATNQNVVGTYSYNPTNGEVTINKTGKYRFLNKATADTANGARQTSLVRLQRFNGISFADLPTAVGPSVAYGYHRNNASGENTIGVESVVDVVAGQRFRCTIECTTAGLINTIPAGTSLIVQEI